MAGYGTDTRKMAHGSTYRFTITVKNATTGVVQDIGTWTSFWLTIKQDVSDADAAAIVTKTLGAGITKSDAANGQITCEIVRADTINLDYKPYSLVYDAWGVDPSGFPWNLVSGCFLIDTAVSRTTH